jgi:hypothetical protein
VDRAVAVSSLTYFYFIFLLFRIRPLSFPRNLCLLKDTCVTKETSEEEEEKNFFFSPESRCGSGGSSRAP